MEVEQVLLQAKEAKDKGASRFCMGAAWRNPTDKSLDKVIPMIKGVKELGMEACVTLGMLTQGQAIKLKEAGLDYYNRFQLLHYQLVNHHQLELQNHVLYVVLLYQQQSETTF